MERRSTMLLFRWVKPHHHIVLLILFTSLAMILGYTISVSSNDVNALFPYISDTGTKPPASCVFGLMLNLAGTFAFVTMFIRHRYFEKYCASERRLVHVLNDIALFLGFISAFGIFLVANFQESNLIVVHLIGAVLTFALGIMYCWMHSYLSYVTMPAGFTTKLQFLIRCILTGTSTLALVAVFSGASVAKMKYEDANNGTSTAYNLHWDSDDPGYDAHLVSTFSEWIMVFSFIFYFSTFYNDFKYLGSYVNIECYMGLRGESPIRNMLDDSRSSTHAVDC